ncbi:MULTISPECIES: collagen-like triple helix repeat-containing protein [unclassified Vibrio]|uniref:collagen-like triple helix repeat-containing protein n=1 Tax=unclassified Vibrio TaxID=2614977 RepID=UPI0013610E0D|nr:MULTISPECIES: collagen-like triple helix repeat-containing protein [unclassified Vibrio]NAW57160.1 hypothetical protein [Vibrio sp. V36_P2S2PM302]NAX24545.1 hypothetical protein [Vibrio sp. V38_P2S17PM301]NAX31111.1 hypothetical protein [Vibrio sp. V37_P2S8PM304]
MDNSTSLTGVALLLTLFLSVAGCSGSGSGSASGGGGGSDVNSVASATDDDAKQDDNNVNDDVAEEDGNLVTDVGNVISQGDLPDYADSITTGSGDVLVNLGGVVTELGSGLPLDPASLDGNYLNTTLEGATGALAQTGTMVVSAGDAIAQLDALPVFVQLNDQTGILTYAGGTVSELGGTLEQVGDTLQFHVADENGGLYNLAATLSAVTAPLVTETNGMIDLKGNALVLFQDTDDLQENGPQFVFLTGNNLVEGTQALLSNPEGYVDGLGTVFIGDNGLTALVMDESSDNTNSILTSTLSTLDTQLSNTGSLDGQQVLDGDSTLASVTGVLTEVDGNQTILTQDLGSLLNTSGLLSGDVLNTDALGGDTISQVTSSLVAGTTTLGTESGESSGLVDNTADLLNGVNDSLLGDSEQTSVLNETLNSVLQTESETEEAGLLDSVDNQVLDPLLGKLL